MAPAKEWKPNMLRLRGEKGKAGVLRDGLTAKGIRLAVLLNNAVGLARRVRVAPTSKLVIFG